MPSSCRHTPATTAAIVRGQGELRVDGPGAFDEHAHRGSGRYRIQRRRSVGRGCQGADQEPLLGADAQGDPAGDQQRQPRAGFEQLGGQRRRLEQVLQVVQHQQRLAPAQVFHQQLAGGASARLAHPQGARYGRRDQPLVVQRGQVDKDDAVEVGAGQRVGHGQRQARLAHTTGPEQRQQAHRRVGGVQQRPGCRHLGVAADECGRWHRERRPRGRGRAGRRWPRRIGPRCRAAGQRQESRLVRACQAEGVGQGRRGAGVRVAPALLEGRDGGRAQAGALGQGLLAEAAAQAQGAQLAAKYRPLVGSRGRVRRAVLPTGPRRSHPP